MEQSLSEKLTGAQLVMKYPIFYGTQRFITAFTRAHHLSLARARWIQSIPLVPLLQVHFNIILPSGSSKWSPNLISPHQNPVCICPLPHMCYMPHPSHSSLFDDSNNIWWGVQIIQLIMQFHHSPGNSSLLGPNILLNTLFLSTLSLRSSFNVSDQVLHPYKIYIYIYIYIYI